MAGGVCMTGILRNKWTMKDFMPLRYIPSTFKLTVRVVDFNKLREGLLKFFIIELEAGHIHLNINGVFGLNQVVEAHQYMEGNRAKGKVVFRI